MNIFSLVGIIGGADGPTQIFLKNSFLDSLLYVLIPLGIVAFAIYWRFGTENKYKERSRKKKQEREKNQKMD